MLIRCQFFFLYRARLKASKTMFSRYKRRADAITKASNCCRFSLVPSGLTDFENVDLSGWKKWFHFSREK